MIAKKDKFYWENNNNKNRAYLIQQVKMERCARGSRLIHKTCLKVVTKL